MRPLFEGYLPYVLALAWMWAASRVPLRRLVLNGIVGLFLLLLAASAMPHGGASQIVRLLMLIGVAFCFFTHGPPDTRNLN
jgi:hypothetical protein